LGVYINLCKKCKNSKYYANHCPYIVIMIPHYFSSILKYNPLKVQMLSFLDILMILDNCKYGLVFGHIRNTSLLKNPNITKYYAAPTLSTKRNS
jgi:hypothetical protein